MIISALPAIEVVPGADAAPARGDAACAGGVIVAAAEVLLFWCDSRGGIADRAKIRNSRRAAGLRREAIVDKP